MIFLNEKKPRTLWLIALAPIIIALLLNVVLRHFYEKERGPKVDCTSYFSSWTDIKTEGVLTLRLDGEGHGRINVSATAKDAAGAKQYKLLRDIDFDYRYEGEGYLAMQHLAVSKKVSDTMPNERFNTSIFDFSGEVRRLRLTSLDNGYIIWNAFSPALMCIQAD